MLRYTIVYHIRARGSRGHGGDHPGRVGGADPEVLRGSHWSNTARLTPLVQRYLYNAGVLGSVGLEVGFTK